MKFKDQKEFFEVNGKRHILQYDRDENENTYSCNFEEMYQHFKARMAEESGPVKNKAMVLVDAGVINHAIHNIRNKLQDGVASPHGVTAINGALKIIESQLK